MALTDELLGISYGDKITTQITEEDFHHLSDKIFEQLSTLRKWEDSSQHSSQVFPHVDVNDSEDSEEELPDLPSSKASDTWKEDGLLNYYYGIYFTI